MRFDFLFAAALTPVNRDQPPLSHIKLLLIPYFPLVKTMLTHALSGLFR